MKITIAGQLRVLQAFLISMILIAIISLSKYGFEPIIWRVYGISAIVLGVPVLLLHMGYYRVNKNMEVFIREDTVTIIKNSETHTYTVSEMKNIVISKSAAMDKGGIPLTPFESYFYVCINLVNGKRIYLTSMLDKNIDEKIKVLKGIEFIREKSIFSFI